MHTAQHFESSVGFMPFERVDDICGNGILLNLFLGFLVDLLIFLEL